MTTEAGAFSSMALRSPLGVQVQATSSPPTVEVGGKSHAYAVNSSHPFTRRGTTGIDYSKRRMSQFELEAIAHHYGTVRVEVGHWLTSRSLSRPVADLVSIDLDHRHSYPVVPTTRRQTKR